MGSYNVSCALSNLSIGYGDRVYFVPLVSNPYQEKEPGWKMFRPLCSITEEFVPSCIPLKGTYDDCGSIDFDDRSKNVLTNYNQYIENPENVIWFQNQDRENLVFSSCYFLADFVDEYIDSKKFLKLTEEYRMGGTNAVNYVMDEFKKQIERYHRRITEIEMYYTDSEDYEEWIYYARKQVWNSPVAFFCNSMTLHDRIFVNLFTDYESYFDDVSLMVKLGLAMLINIKTWRPQYSGSQGGNTEAEVLFAQHLSKFTRARLKEEKRQMNED